ncbi:hypothetical protein Dimus_010056 [Dionaea muscipula]
MARQASRLLATLSSKISSPKPAIAPAAAPSLGQSRHFAAAPPPPPGVFVDHSTRVICQGITGKNGTFHTEQAIEYGTQMESGTEKPVVAFIAGLTAPPGRRMGHAGEITGRLSSRFLIRESNNTGFLPSLIGWRSFVHTTTVVKENENGRSTDPMAFVRKLVDEDGRNFFGSSQPALDIAEEKLVDVDVVHIKLIKNNTFVTVTDSKGNKKAGASSGCLEEMKGGPKVSRYAAEATAEHVGRLARKLGLKSVVMRVNGFTHFKKKKQAILSWREGFTNGRGDQNPIVFIEDTTRKPHNGCRLRKRRRI